MATFSIKNYSKLIVFYVTAWETVTQWCPPAAILASLEDKQTCVSNVTNSFWDI